jgi:hypothetical protein
MGVMKRSALSSLATVAFLGTIAFGAPAGAASTTFAGTIEIEATISIASNVPANTPISATAEFFSNGNAGGNTGTVTTNVKYSGKTATVTLRLPYFITGPVKPTVFGVSLQVTAQGTQASNASISAQFPLPANGATTVVKLPLTI